MRANKLKVLHINCNYIGTTLHQLMIEELDRRGIENEVFVPTYNRNIAVITPNENVYVSECFKKWDRLVFDYKQRKIIRAIEEHYDIASFDLIHAYTLFTDGNVARVLSEKYGVPYVVAVRNTDVNDFLKKMIHLRYRGLMNMIRAQNVFFLSNSYRNAVREKYIPKKYWKEISDKSVIIPNGIDDYWIEHTYYRTEDIKKNTKINIIYAGGIDRNKNITMTQEAINLLLEKGYRLEFSIIGKVKDKKVYSEICKKSHSKIFPPMKKEQLISMYRKADIFVMPSHTESFGLVYAEAMTQGLPVIYTRGQGFDGQFEEGEVGFSVSDQSPYEIAEKILKCVNEYDRLCGNESRLAGKFKWSLICDAYIKIYESIQRKIKC